jgi:hypothetical protein
MTSNRPTLGPCRDWGETPTTLALGAVDPRSAFRICGLETTPRNMFCAQQLNFTSWDGCPDPEVLPMLVVVVVVAVVGAVLGVRLGDTRLREGPGGMTLGFWRGRPPKARHASPFALASDAMPGELARAPVSHL